MDRPTIKDPEALKTKLETARDATQALWSAEYALLRELGATAAGGAGLFVFIESLVGQSETPINDADLEWFLGQIDIAGWVEDDCE